MGKVALELGVSLGDNPFATKMEVDKGSCKSLMTIAKKRGLEVSLLVTRFMRTQLIHQEGSLPTSSEWLAAGSHNHILVA